MIRMTPISLILIGFNFSNKRKVTHWFFPPFYKDIAESVDLNETQVDTDACAEILIEVNHLVDALRVRRLRLLSHNPSAVCITLHPSLHSEPTYLCNAILGVDRLQM